MARALLGKGPSKAGNSRPEADGRKDIPGGANLSGKPLTLHTTPELSG
jgi:hypothetical protein